MTSPSQDPTMPYPAFSPETDNQRRLPALTLIRAMGEKIIQAHGRVNVPRYEGEEQQAGLARLREHMVDISADPSGSDLASYIDLPTANAILDFEEMLQGKPAEERWRGATLITHDDVTFRWFGRRSKTTGKNPKLTPVLDDEGQPVFGIRIGYLNAQQFETPVMYCSDGKLRMLIKTTGDKHHSDKNHRRSYYGYCRLPDPEILAPVRTRGATTLVSYKHQQSRTLRQDLGLKTVA